MNEDTQAESLSRIKLKYSVNEMGSSNVYDLDRSCSIKNGKPIEKFEVYFNGLHIFNLQAFPKHEKGLPTIYQKRKH